MASDEQPSYLESIGSALDTFCTAMDKAHETTRQIAVGCCLTTLVLMVTQGKWTDAEKQFVQLCRTFYELYPEYFWTRKQIRQFVLTGCLLCIGFSLLAYALFFWYIDWISTQGGLFGSLVSVGMFLFMLALVLRTR